MATRITFFSINNAVKLFNNRAIFFVTKLSKTDKRKLRPSSKINGLQILDYKSKNHENK